MAILVASSTTPPDPGTDTTVPDRWTGPESGPYLTWTSAGGRVTSLEDFRDRSQGTMAMPGVLGLGMPGYTFFEDSSPVSDGALVRGTPRANPKDITVPIHIWAATRKAARQRYGAFVEDLNPQNGPGLLTVHERDGTSRQIPAYYSQGIEGSGSDDGDGDGPTWFTFAAVFHAPRPYWLGDERSVLFELAGSGSFYPFAFPMLVADSSPGGAVQLANAGNTDVFPVWTVTGPAASVTLTNETTGKTLRVDYALTIGDTLQIDTRDGAKYVQLNGVTNLWPAVGDGSSLWPLRGGINRLTLAAPDATSTTTITAAFQERFLTAM